MQGSGVARAQPLPGHSMGTLRLRVASCLGPVQLSAAYSTEMEKQLGGSGDAPPENFEIFELPRSILGLPFRPYRCLELEHFDNAFATNLRARSVRSLWYLRKTHVHRDQGSLRISFI